MKNSASPFILWHTYTKVLFVVLGIGASLVGGCFSELCSLQGFRTLECVWVGRQDRENLFKQEEAHRQSVDCASSCPAHGRIEFKMMSPIFSWHAIIKTAAIRS